MSSYSISNNQLNLSRVFILQKSELEKRLDPFYYVPELLELEKKVLAKEPKKLREYVVGISSGATPKRDEENKYYSDKENGIPFLRVQNVTEFGLDLTDVKFINKDTHEGYLKRSQISEGNLIVTITGRIASAAVAPDGFIGNTNQHSVVIKTGSKEVSENLAAYLNCSIGQKLANRLATGGTRPALDYPALLSIPIIEDKRILEITSKVVEQKKKNEAEAEKLLSSIDDYLLIELGIKLPEPPKNTLRNRIFTTTLREVSNYRFDPNYYQDYHKQNYFSIEKSKFKSQLLKDITDTIFQGVGRNMVDNSDFILLKVKNIKQSCEIDFDDTEPIGNFPDSKFLKFGDIITPCIGEAVRQIKFAIFDKENGKYLVDNNTGVIRPTEAVNSYFLKYCLCSSIGKIQISRLIGGGGVPFLGSDNLKRFIVPIPPLDKQKEIAEHITGIRQQAQQLKDKTNELLKKASEEIEKIFLI